MNFKFVCFNILFFVCNISFAQTRIVDIDDNAPIPFIHVISDKGIIVGTSNIDGMIDLKSISAVTGKINGSVSFHHISYQSKEIKMENLIKSDTIKLTKNNFMIPEIVITDKSLKPVYLLLKGFYRSYQIENGIPKYYTDGIVEYYISKNQLKNRIIQHRTFRNKKLVDAEKRRNIMVSMVVAGTPYINPKTEIDELNKDYSFERLDDKLLIKKWIRLLG